MIGIALLIYFFMLVFFIIGIIQIIIAFKKKRKSKIKFGIRLIIGLLLMFPFTATIRYLINDSIKMNKVNDEKKGDLNTAIQLNNLEDVKKNLKIYDINGIRYFIEGSYYHYYTPLSYAVHLNNLKIAEYLVANGADVNLNGTINLSDTMPSSSKPNYEETLTPLMTACQNNNLEIVKFLISKNALVNKSTNKDSPFTLALKHGNLALIKYLVQNGADTNTLKFNFNKTPLYLLAENNPDTDILNYLYNTGIDRNINYSKYGENIFWIAVKKKASINFIQTLIDKGADITIKDFNGNNALDYAIQYNNSDLANILRKKGLKETKK